MKSIIFLAIAFSFVLTSSCKKYVEVGSPSTSSDADIVFSSDATAAAVTTGIFFKMNVSPLFIINSGNSLSYFPELSADNLVLASGLSDLQTQMFYINGLSATTDQSQTYWGSFYSAIYITNTVIEGASKSNNLSKEVKDQVLGEAYFMRAFFYFYLVNLYGDVPLVLSTAYRETADIGRTAKAEVNQRIVSDLLHAEELLNEQYVDATLRAFTLDRLRPNKYAARALLARQYLFMGDYVNADKYSSTVIENVTDYQVIPPDQVFLKNSKETIWALQPLTAGQNTKEAQLYIIPNTGPDFGHPAYLSQTLINSFENDDERKEVWVDSVEVNGQVYAYPSKYKIVNVGEPVNEYGIVLRLAEQYFIRSEARLRQGNILAAQEDLNVIRQRSGLAATAASSEEDMLNAILHERNVELFAEYGHRWFDIKRTGKIQDVMLAAATFKGTVWEPEFEWYPVPASEIQKNPNLFQNSGY
jgi:starch-binding outer membrane protein, SusD/RagB family